MLIMMLLRLSRWLIGLLVSAALVVFFTAGGKDMLAYIWDALERARPVIKVVALVLAAIAIVPIVVGCVRLTSRLVAHLRHWVQQLRSVLRRLQALVDNSDGLRKVVEEAPNVERRLGDIEQRLRLGRHALLELGDYLPPERIESHVRQYARDRGFSDDVQDHLWDDVKHVMSTSRSGYLVIARGCPDGVNSATHRRTRGEAKAELERHNECSVLLLVHVHEDDWQG